jgi:hypothetical protein
MDQQINYWRIGLLLLALFWVLCFPGFIGLELHQWLGLAAFGLAVWHLLAHWKWILAVTRRFFSGTSIQARLFYILDGGVLLGFWMILITGLMISTWLDLPLYDFPAWTHIHLMVSIFTLLLVVAKLILHWRWVANAVRRYGLLPVSIRTGAGGPQRAGNPVSRRDFLKLTGVLGAVSAVTIHGMLEPSRQAQSLSSAPEQAGDGNSQRSATAAPSPQTADPVLENPALASATIETVPTPNLPKAEPAIACTVLCPNGCSFPGRCRRYIDANKNNLCDNGECL